MLTSTPADRLRQLQERLDWAAYLLALQPGDIQSAFHQAGQEVAEALIAAPFSFQTRLPQQVLIDSSVRRVPARWRTIQAGNFLNQLRKIPCNRDVINALSSLTGHSDIVVATAGQLVAYSAARQILDLHIPDIAFLRKDYTVFDRHGHLLALNDNDAESAIGQLSRFVEWMHTVEKLYPGWTASDRYNETYSQITDHLAEQGRFLATYYTERMIEDLTGRWRRGELARGLTLFIPYLDEHHYRMDIYRVVVVPNARIPFRPQFVVSACRVAQREVRQDPRLSQGTRWQLIAQLDRIVRAFETRPEASPREPLHNP